MPKHTQYKLGDVCTRLSSGKGIDYLSSLLPSVSGLKYLKQKKRIEQDIERWKASIRSEEINELLESW